MEIGKESGLWDADGLMEAVCVETQGFRGPPVSSTVLPMTGRCRVQRWRSAIASGDSPNDARHTRDVQLSLPEGCAKQLPTLQVWVE